jgi:hypothetical protein
MTAGWFQGRQLPFNDHSLIFHMSASSVLSVRQPKLTSSTNRRGGIRLKVSLLLTLLLL